MHASDVGGQTIQRALRSALPRCTKLVIAHRLDSIIDADLIWLLENGRLVEEVGTSEFPACYPQSSESTAALVPKTVESVPHTENPETLY